tara:strand:+ start:622 stop:975 length:354 start_codon:yes stop_codon:yes gene_type:complete
MKRYKITVGIWVASLLAVIVAMASAPSALMGDTADQIASQMASVGALMMLGSLGFLASSIMQIIFLGASYKNLTLTYIVAVVGTFILSGVIGLLFSTAWTVCGVIACIKLWKEERNP